MSDYKLFYNFSTKDRDKGMAGLYLDRPRIVGLLESDGYEVKFAGRMRYIRLPKSDKYPLDLKEGYECYKHRPEDYFRDRLSQVAFYIIQKDVFGECYKQGGIEMKFGKEEHNYDVISCRGVLSTLMEAPYKFGIRLPSPIKWTIRATHFKGKLFLTVNKHDEENLAARRLNINSSYHFKFEQYCLTDNPHRDPNTNGPIDESQQLFCILRSKLKNFNLLYSAEMNGIVFTGKLCDVNNEAEISQSRYAHTKLMKASFNNWMQNYRILSWWLKAYLASVNDIYIGFKTNQGLVEEPVQHILAQDLPKGQRWCPKVCIQFAYLFIAKVHEEMQDIDCPYTCYEFAFDSDKECIEYRTHHSSSEYSFLNEHIIDYLRRVA